jgi:ketosteroid isomerase-like protein
VGERNLEVIRSLYGFDWIGIGSRERGFQELERLMDQGFQARVSPELGDRELQGRVVVSGRILARGRTSKMPLASEFGHLWSLKDGRVLRVEAFLDRASAEQAAGMGES